MCTSCAHRHSLIGADGSRKWNTLREAYRQTHSRHPSSAPRLHPHFICTQIYDPRGSTQMHRNSGIKIPLVVEFQVAKRYAKVYTGVDPPIPLPVCTWTGTPTCTFTRYTQTDAGDPQSRRQRSLRDGIRVPESTRAPESPSAPESTRAGPLLHLCFRPWPLQRGKFLGRWLGPGRVLGGRRFPG